MLLFISGLVCLLAVAIGPIRDIINRQRGLLSVRNLFLLGFVFFYAIASMLYSFHGGNPKLYVAQGNGPLILAFLMPVFLLVYYAAEGAGRRLAYFSRLMPKAPLPSTTPAIWTAIGVFCLLGLVALAIGGNVRAEGRNFNYTQVLALQFRNAFAAAAMALATYYLICRRLNPISWVLFFGILITTTVITTAGGAGRRNWLTVMLAIPFVWYWASLRYAPITKAIGKMAIPVAVGFVFLLAYTGVRHQLGQRAGTQERIQQLKGIATNVEITDRAAEIVFMQDTPQNTVFIIEQYPEMYPRKPLVGLLYVVGTPIPRALWQGKPQGLGIEIMEQMNANATLAPGIIGHGWAEAGIIGVIYYALFFGVFIALLDICLHERAHNPFFLAAISAAIGNMIAMCRGDTPLFLVQVLAGWFAVFLLLFLIRTFVGPIAASFPPVVPPVPAFADAPAAEDDFAYEQPEWEDEHALANA
ncbi:MAG: hypothetical protein KF866_09925 [Phycisphaeraceae bacterium]|nr:hypothetical protein [Phycisphaeraceae bacterium]